MIDPRRLVDGSDLGAALLASASSDTPTRKARHRVSAALGLAASIATATSAPSVAGSTNGPGPIDPMNVGAGAAGGRAGASTWFTLVGGGLIAASIAGGLILATGGVRATPRPDHEVAAGAVATPTRAPAPETTAANESPAGAGARPAPAQVAVDPPRGRASRTSPDQGFESPLARELRALDTARSALDRREIGDALGALDRYERTFPNGTLRTEASLLRIEALLARGDAVEARKLARELLAHDPSGPHARRLRTIVENQ